MPVSLGEAAVAHDFSSSKSRRHAPVAAPRPGGLQLLATPAHPDVELAAQLHDDPLDRAKCRARDASPLYARDRRLRQPRPGGEVRLPSAEAPPERPQRSPEPLPIHGRRMHRTDRLGLICGIARRARTAWETAVTGLTRAGFAT